MDITQRLRYVQPDVQDMMFREVEVFVGGADTGGSDLH